MVSDFFSEQEIPKNLISDEMPSEALILGAEGVEIIQHVQKVPWRDRRCVIRSPPVHRRALLDASWRYVAHGLP